MSPATLRKEVAADWGMDPVPVAGGGGDNAAGAAGIGVITPGDAFLSLGTSGVLFLVTPKFLPNSAKAVHAFCHCLPNLWHQMSVMLSAASCVDWAVKLTGTKDAAELLSKVEKRARLDGPEIFLPYLSGERTPHNDPAARGVLFGLNHDSDAAAIGQAVLEGVAFAFADGLDVLIEAGATIDKISVIGGGARSMWWGGVLSAALKRPLIYRDASEVGPAFGAARLARIAKTARTGGGCVPPAARACGGRAQRARHSAAGAQAPEVFPDLSGPSTKIPRSLIMSTAQPLPATTSYFGAVPPIKFEGLKSDNPLAFRYYNKDQLVLGKRMEDLLRPAVCYWHSFAWNGHDIFGAGTFDRPWNAGVMDQAAAWMKMDAAFDFFTRLGAPFYCFHDVDAMPTAANIKEHVANFAMTVDRLEKKQAETGIKLLWGTANLFSHPRFMGGASTNPDPEVWAFAATQVRHCMDATKRLGGANYVLWGGREGYDTLLNTNLKRELDNFGRFLQAGGRAQAQDRLQGHDPHRAQAARAHQAPVRLRYRDRVRLPQEERSRERSEGEHRGQPRHARRPQLRSRNRHGRCARHLRLHRHQPRRSAERLGHRPVPQRSART